MNFSPRYDELKGNTDNFTQLHSFQCERASKFDEQERTESFQLFCGFSVGAQVELILTISLKLAQESDGKVLIPQRNTPKCD